MFLQEMQARLPALREDRHGTASSWSPRSARFTVSPMDQELLRILSNPDRLRALADAELMDSPQEERFDRYTRLACEILHAPVALVSLVDDHRQFFKSMVGLKEPWATLRETPLSHSFCKHAVASGRPLIVTNAPEHPLVRDNRAVHELGVIAYAGVPLVAEDHALGVLCVVDGRPRTWTKEEMATLHVLGAAVTAEIELSQARRASREKDALLNAITESSLDSIITINGAGEIVFCNDAVKTAFGLGREELYGRPLTSLMPERYRDAHREGVARVEAGGEARVIGRVVELHGLRKSGDEFPLELAVSRWQGRTGAYYTGILRDVSARVRAAAEQRDAEEKLRLTIDNAPIGIALVALDGHWLRVNQALCRIVGYTQEELLRIDFQTITHPDDLTKDLQLAQRLIEGEIPAYSLEKRYLHRDGHVVSVLLSVSLVRAPSGEPSFFVSQIQDISQRLEAERRTNEQAAIIRAVIESMGDFVMVCGADGQVAILNDTASRLFGPYLQTGMAGEWESEYGLFLQDKKTRCPLADMPLARALRGESVEQMEMWVRMPNWPEGRWHSVTANPVRDVDGLLVGAVNVGRDITVRKELEEQVRQASLVDELTGLQNRRGFMLLGEQLLKIAARYGRSLFVLFADLDGLKQVNDQLGHEVGDRAMTDFAGVLLATFRRADVVARLGGDEFVVLAEGDARVAAGATDRLERKLKEHNEVAGRAFELSASVGIAHYDAKQTSSLSELVASADKLMYDAKRKNKRAARLRREGQ